MTVNTVLVLNSGSSSLKYQLVDPETGRALAQGLVEQVGEAVGHIKHKAYPDSEQEIVKELDQEITDHVVAMDLVEKMFEEVGPRLDETNIVAVGHRVVQGGKHFDGPVLVNDETYQLIADLCPLAPLHNPANLKGIDAGRKILPDVPHVVVFDTAFFQHLPAEAHTYALNQELAEKYQVRRYGAHGTSHQYVSAKVAEFLGREDLKQIVLHLGNGASASAVVNGKAVDTSMGLTPLEGLVMGTRTGDIDPAVVFHLARQGGYSIDEIDTILNKQSGMKGLCGNNDMRGVREMANNGDPAAILALKVYVHRLLHYVGSYQAVMGGLDTIAFTAGIGENDVDVRAELCERLAYLGLKLDAEANRVRSDQPRVISTPDSTVTVLVVPTNEELAIARQAVSLL